MSDQSSFNQASRKWQDLSERNVFSAPEAEGTVAVLNTSCVLSTGDSEHDNQLVDALHKEAEDISDRLDAAARDVILVHKAERSDIAEAFADDSIASVTIIGSGILSAVSAYDNGEKKFFDWSDASESVTALKTGPVVQRFCGVFGREFNIPLGYFTVSDHKNLYTPYRQMFVPEQQSDGLMREFEENKILPLGENLQGITSYKVAKTIFGRFA